MDNPASAVSAISAIDTVWVLVCAVLVFFMNTGFAQRRYRR